MTRFSTNWQGKALLHYCGWCIKSLKSIFLYLQDDSIVAAIPPPGLLPPSRFMKKPPPVNAIRLEDLEKELTGDNSAPQQVPELPKEAPRKTMIGQPPPGIPRPMMAPPGFRSPAPRMVSVRHVILCDRAD